MSYRRTGSPLSGSCVLACAGGRATSCLRRLLAAPTKPPRSPREVRSNKDAQQEASPVAVPAPTHTATDSQPASQDTPQGTHTPDTQPTDGDGDGDEAQAADSTAGSKDVQDLSEVGGCRLRSLSRC